MDEQATDQANKQPDEPEQEPTTEDILLENLSNDAIRFINKTMQGGHADSRHVNRSVVDVLDRTLKNAPPKEQKKNFSSSAFASPNDFYDYVTRTMIEAITDISTWLQDPTTKPFGTDFSTKNKFIGYGFKYQGKVPSIFEYKSRGCHIELSKKQRKDPTKPYTLDDIRLVTAYPIITEPDGQQQLKDLRPLIRQTPEYKNANPVRQAWLDYIGKQEIPAHLFRTKQREPHRSRKKADTLYADVPRPDFRHEPLTENTGSRGTPGNPNVLPIKPGRDRQRYHAGYPA